MTELLGSILIGLLIGVGTNLIAWWILFHYIVPKIHFSPSISKIPTKDNKLGYKYRIKIQNSGKRSIIDVEFRARLRIKGLLDNPKHWKLVSIPLYGNTIVNKFPIIEPAKQKTSGWAIQIYLNNVDEFRNLPYPEDIRKKSKEESLLLEDVMGMGSETSIQIFAFGYDEFSGSRKYFESKSYTINDIKEGPFDGLKIKKQIAQWRPYVWERFK